MPDPKNPDHPEEISTPPAEETEDVSAVDAAAEEDTPEERVDDPAPVDAPVAPEKPVAPEEPVVDPEPEPEPESADAPTVQIPVRNHIPKAPPQRIAPRVEQPAAPEPPRVEIQPTPTRIPPAQNKRRARWLVAALAAVAVVVVAIVAVLFFQNRADNSPESRIRASIDTFVDALAAGDLGTLRDATCGGLADFYASVEPNEFEDVHRLAVEQGAVPVVNTVDRVQITDDTAIAEVTAHTTGSPADVTARTFDLTLVGEDWKICSE